MRLMRAVALTLLVGVAAAAARNGTAAARNATTHGGHGNATTWWKPTQGLAFQYQLSQKLDPQLHFIPGVQVYVVDGFDTSAEAVAALKARGNKTHPVFVVCYISAGTWEDWRPDADLFGDTDKGAPLGNWPGEQYANYLSGTVRDIMRTRMEMCRDKGFDAVDPDNVDAYANPTGLGLSDGDQLGYNLWLASTAHGLGLAVGLKNDLGQLKELAPAFDFFVNEQCHVYSECSFYAPGLTGSKPVWNIEYEPQAFLQACKEEEAATGPGPRVRTVFKNVTLDFCRHDCSKGGVPRCPDSAAAGAPLQGSGAGAATAPTGAWLLSVGLAWLLASTLAAWQ